MLVSRSRHSGQRSLSQHQSRVCPCTMESPGEQTFFSQLLLRPLGEIRGPGWAAGLQVPLLPQTTYNELGLGSCVLRMVPTSETKCALIYLLRLRSHSWLCSQYILASLLKESGHCSGHWGPCEVLRLEAGLANALPFKLSL